METEDIRAARRDCLQERARGHYRLALEELPGRWIDEAVRWYGTEVSRIAADLAHRRMS